MAGRCFVGRAMLRLHGVSKSFGALQVLDDVTCTVGAGERGARADRQGALQERFGQLDGYRAESQIATVLAGLGFRDDQRRQPVATFSGGWQMRIALAKLLVRPPDLLLLDEPTNHLDLAAAEWLE